MLEGCDERAAGAPDIRGLWEVFEVEVGGECSRTTQCSGNASEWDSAATHSS